jgi:glycine cleavage system H protein
MLAKSKKYNKLIFPQAKKGGKMSEKELKYLDGLKYTKEHEWVKVEGDIAVVGISDFAQDQLTDIVFIELPEVGKKVEQGKSFCAVESVKSVSDIFAPVSGEVVEANKELENKPELVNEDPYGKGWVAKIKISDKAELDNLMSAEEYKKFVSDSH